MAGQPVPHNQLPAGVVCALTTGGGLSDGELRAIADFRDLLAERAEVKRAYTARLKAMSPADPMYAALWDERAAKLRALDGAFSANDYTDGA
jgi:hypothetical protein